MPSQNDSRSDGHGFPQDPDICMKLRVPIRREDPASKKIWKPSPYSVVCRNLFLDSDYKPSDTGKKRRLKRGAMPAVFSFKKVNEPRKPRHYVIDVEDVPDLGSEVEICSPGCDEIICQSDDVDHTEDLAIQCSLLSQSSSRFSIHHITDNDKAVLYYTGFDNYDHFMHFVRVLGPSVNHLSYQCSLIPPEDQLFMTLLKFRQARDEFDLSMLFHISESTVSTIILTWTNFLYFQLTELNIWASHDTVQDTMPESFKEHFPSTRVILDETETPICKPGNVDYQRATFSRYKNRNTLKTMIGCS